MTYKKEAVSIILREYNLKTVLRIDDDILKIDAKLKCPM